MKRLVYSTSIIFSASLSRLYRHLIDDDISFAVIGARDQDTGEVRQDELYVLVSEYNNKHHNGYNKAFGRYEYQGGAFKGVSMDEPSVIIYNIPKSDALEIASAINQESIVYKDSDEFGIFYVSGASPELFETHGLDFDSKDSEGVKLAEKFGSMLDDKGSWNPDKPVGKKSHFVFTAYKGTPNSWKTKKIVGSESEKLSTTYTRLFTIEMYFIATS